MKRKLKIGLKYTAYIFCAILLLLILCYLYLLSLSSKQGDVTWQSCYRPSYWRWFVLPPSINLQCATVNVPVDYTKPDSKQFTLALTRLPSKAPNPIGDLLILNGGPGGHSLDMSYALIANDEYGKRVKNNFNIIGYAPRGIAPSNPVIDCGGVEHDGNAKLYMDECIKHTGIDILPFISSREVIKDLDKIRQYLSVDTWSMIGYSYGTKLVANYAKYYPEHLRAGIADGVVDTAEDLPTILLNQNKSAQLTFDTFIKTCDESCSFKAKNSTEFLTNLKNIENKNLKDSNGQPIDSESIISLIAENLNDENHWDTLKTMLNELNIGKTDTYHELKLLEKLGNLGFNNDALNLINCADSAPKLDKNAYIAQAKQIDHAAKFDDIKPQADDDYLDACYYWKWQATDTADEYLINNKTPNLLFISYEHDFATPYANAQTMANRFDDPLVVISGKHGHTITLFETNTCVDDYAVRYLLKPSIDFGKKLLICQ